MDSVVPARLILNADNELDYFNAFGRRIPTAKSRVFGSDFNSYYRLNQPVCDYAAILKRGLDCDLAPQTLGPESFTDAANSLAELIRANPNYANLFKGVHVPFVIGGRGPLGDLGRNLEEELLPCVGKAFGAEFPESHFKAVLQGNSKLAASVTLDPRSNYGEFLRVAENQCVVGWYFPQALQEFDIESQRQQMEDLPSLPGTGVCLSGGIDICASLVGSPSLLINSDAYAPILCMSSYVHGDDRLVLLIKSYGPHLEFWCMSQMLTPASKQVSEQWAGGITIYRSV